MNFIMAMLLSLVQTYSPWVESMAGGFHVVSPGGFSGLSHLMRGEIIETSPQHQGSLDWTCAKAPLKIFRLRMRG